MKIKRKERKARATHLELLGGVPTDALRRIREVAAEADLPIERVFRDVVAIGVSVVSDPDESPYSSLIAFRSGLAHKQEELEHVQYATVEPGQVSGAGAETEQLSTGALLEIAADDLRRHPEEPESIAAGPGDALERSGQPTSNEEDSGLFSQR